MNFNPRNILIINFGQLGDVILSLPALAAVRHKFPDAQITAMIGKSSAELIELSGFADEKIAVDRVKLRDSGKFWSIKEILKIAAGVRRRRYDFIIDLHSLSETNLLGYFSGAKHRLYINRESRSLDYLGNFKPKPPPEDKTRHATDRYLDALRPLGIENAPRLVQIYPKSADVKTIGDRWQTITPNGAKLIGFFPGAGHPSRRWSLDNFAAATKELESAENTRTFVFLGPEEADLRPEIEKTFPENAHIVDNLTVSQLAAAMARLDVLISNDTGAMHVGALVGTPIVLLIDRRAPTTYLPLTENLIVPGERALEEISVADVVKAANVFLES